MEFTVKPYTRRSRTDGDIAGGRQCFLQTDNWDDYSYKASFFLVYLDADGTRHDIGPVKIVRHGMSTGYTEIDNSFTALGTQYAALGQNQEYYENLEGPRVTACVASLTDLSSNYAPASLWRMIAAVDFNVADIIANALRIAEAISKRI